MSLRNLTKVPKRSLVYLDQSLLVPDQSVNPAIPAPDNLLPAMNQRPLVAAPPITDSTVPAPDKLPPAVNQRPTCSCPSSN